ncbi:MAG: cytochrome b [Geminicoccaceae bacterium]|nr:MAG: cytochrome b [Geminicoccaceae bacterium]
MATHRVEGYDTVQRMLHWLTVAFLLVLIPVGIAMTHPAFRPLQDTLFIIHKNGGVLLFLVLVARVGWRLTHRPSPQPAELPTIHRRVAAFTHFMLYVLLFTMVITGYLRVVGGGFPIELLDALGIPPLIGTMRETATIISAVHKFTAYALVVVIVVHVTAAIQHALVHRNSVMQRIWPPIAPPAKAD